MRTRLEDSRHFTLNAADTPSPERERQQRSRFDKGTKTVCGRKGHLLSKRCWKNQTESFHHIPKRMPHDSVPALEQKL